MFASKHLQLLLIDHYSIYRRYFNAVPVLVLSLLILLLSEDDACAKVRRMPTAADSSPGQLVDMAAKEASASRHRITMSAL
jgi:hypothetical protein